MFRLLKLAAYGLLGYAIYEFARGMTQSEGRSSGGRNRPAVEGNTERPASLTGPSGGGQLVQTQDADGAASAHKVGRGVVHR